MKPFTPIFVALVAMLFVSPAVAGTELYAFDVLKRPTYAATYNRMMQGEADLPKWFARAAVAAATTTSPGTTLKIGSSSEDLFKICQPHRCANGTLAILFSDEGQRSVAAFYNTLRVRFFGNPTLAEQSALEGAAKDGI